MRRTVKQNNRKVILDLIRKVQVFSIADISLETGISKTTVKKVLDYYIGNMLVKEAGKGGSSDEGGKRPSLFQFNKDFGFIISVHFGPDFIKGMLSNMLGESVHTCHFAVNKLQVTDFVDLIVKLVHDFKDLKVLDNRPILSCVLGLPGIVDPKNGLSIYSPHYNDWGSNVPVLSMIKKKLQIDIPFYVENINRYQAFAEKIIGSAQNVDNFLIIDAIEEGVGAGVVINGTIRHGKHNFSGEIGHMVLSPGEEDTCICGGHGCFEALVSRTRIEKLIMKGRNEYPGSLIFHQAKTFELEDLFKAADQKDLLAREVLKDIAYWFSQGVNNVIMINDPQLVIIQGIYTRAGEWFLESIRQNLNQLSYPAIGRSLKLIYSELGQDRGVIGGAVYAIWDYFETTKIYDMVT
ncbi:ROK family protein [Oceanispirochaeta sp.]|uniref:ROK family protein n=1 Tax=Oceanispirochaeta sp. TaxID=2035350 RepID=UPI002621266D|nr:ROK family protein [Oceanispirochaeta sp.]MDA3959060.1 ROK family protein [Oceanispirochaeta sp.]